MKSVSTLLEPVNGRRSRKTVIGTMTLEEPITRKIQYETASWYTLVDVPAGEYDVYLLQDGSITWAMIGYKGLITKEHFVNRLFHSSSVHEPTENIGKERWATVQTYPYIVAEQFANDPRFQLADDYSVVSEEHQHVDGDPHTAYHLIDPDGKRVF